MVSNQVSDTLEKQPEQFLNYLRDPIMKPVFENWIINPKSYRNCISPALIQLLCLVGDLNGIWKDQNNFFGTNTIISEEMGIEIFDLLMEFKPDLEDTDYYGQTLMHKVKEYKNDTHQSLRVNNEKFIKHIKNKLKLCE